MGRVLKPGGGSIQVLTPPAFVLVFVATASQPGPVGYRDPLGVVSPDGGWLAYTEGQHLRLRRVAGGPVRRLGPSDRNVTHLAWLADSRRLASYGRDADSGAAGWLVHDAATGARAPLWPDSSEVGTLRHLSWSSDGRTAVGVRSRAQGSEILTLDDGGGVLRRSESAMRLSFPALAADGRVACLALREGHPRLSWPCGQVAEGAPEAYGPIALSPDGATLFFSSPNDRGTLDLWARTLADGRDERLTAFARDTYAPSVTHDGRVLFKVQDYRTFVAAAPASGGAIVQLSTFQSQTPSWDPTGRWIGITYGTWRRVIDDFHYPNIAQEVGLLSLEASQPAATPARVVSATTSEDQGMCWSPNGKWIALHSHFGLSDDIWLMPAHLKQPPRQITVGGSETGWPRWSPDGKWIVYTTDTSVSDLAAARRQGSFERPREQNAIVLVGVDQQTGEVTQPQRTVPLEGYRGQPLHVEWAPDSERLFFDSNDGGSRRSLNVVARRGGRPARIHAFESDQGYSGIGADPHGRWLAFVARGADGWFQVFRIAAEGGPAEPITTDPSHKTQPSFSPDGRTVAFTVWNYEARFWELAPPRGPGPPPGPGRQAFARPVAPPR